MIVRIGVLAGVLALAAAALWHPAPRPAVTTEAAPAGGARNAEPHAARVGSRRTGERGGIVYVAGAVRRPGLYPANSGERAAAAVANAGGFAPGADPAGVNLAAPVSDGDEIYVPLAGEAPRSASTSRRHAHRRGSHRRDVQANAPEPSSVDVNAAGEDELAGVPGIGAAIAARIVALRAVDGAFTSLDQLLDVSGMTQTRLERARPYLRDP
ncbi:MAG: helix-hairpin-helix domain-containing protein [Candidatus Tumulicola sp.]